MKTAGKVRTEDNKTAIVLKSLILVLASRGLICDFTKDTLLQFLTERTQ